MIDAELIAKVLDGRATPDERARVLAEADRSPELLALLSDSAAALSGEREAEVIPIRRRPMRTSLIVGIAAVLIAAVALPRFLGRGSDGSIVGFDMSATPDAIGAARRGPSLATMRGGPDGDGVKLSVLLGARIVDYITLGTDTARAKVAREIAAALRTTPGGGIVASQFDGAPTATRAMVDAVESVVDTRVFRAAAAAERLRLAAEGNDVKMLGGAELREAFDGLAGDQKLNGEARAIAHQIRSALGEGRGSALSGLAGEFLSALMAPAGE